MHTHHDQFYNNLLTRLSKRRLGYSMEFIRAKSYGIGDTSSGKVEISGMDVNWVKDQHVILVEDVVDTGTTMSQVLPVMIAAGCKSIQVASLLDKRIAPERRRLLEMVKYTGFSIPDHFIVGHGLDFAELYRDLLDIWVVSQAGKDAKGRIATMSP
jgi:hypoxanthine phosphoribosyltransferase